jgi:endogenous inhibitor of DNA gyrase (YacG/DUF329 family)
MPDAPLCVYCRRRPMEDVWRPFCSQRCRMADLGRWLSGDYRVPDTAASDDQAPEDEPDDHDDHTHDES